jgi:arylsulfatase A-like enzyme
LIRKLVPKAVPLLAVVLAAGCAEPPPRPNVVVMVANSLGPGQMGCGGAPEARTPHLDALARSGLQFRTCVSQSPHPFPALATVLTGRFPSGHGAIEEEWALEENHEVAPGVPMMAELIRSRSYRTAAFVEGDQPGTGFGLERGFDLFDAELVRRSLPPPRSLADSALAFMRSGGWPSFVVLVSGGYVEAVEGSARILRRGLEQDGTARHTFFLLTALEGSERGEDGAHRLPAWKLDVPMVVAAPGRIDPALREDPAMLIDVLPTVLQCLGFAPSRLPGRGLLRVADDGDGERPLYAESRLWGDDWERSVRLGDWKAVHDEPEDVWYLYDLSVDPLGTRDLATERREELRRLQAAMPEPGRFYEPPDVADSPAP